MLRVALFLLLFVSLTAPIAAQLSDRPSPSITDVLRREVASGSVVGAQVIVKSNRGRRQAVNLGVVAPADSRGVSDDTVFCIASCSKPVASALIFTLLDRRKLRLDQAAGDLLPALSSPVMKDGTKTRSPTLRELLTHRGGIYSQMQSPTARQLSAIRDFTLTLDESVAVIAEQPLTSAPGTSYAYSGAGYCLVGAMAEKAAGKDIESLLQQNVCEPLGMTSTTYFPTARDFAEIAAGGPSPLQPPHGLGSRLKLPLIGGSLHTTARDLERFARMVLQEGRFGRERVLTKTAHSHFVSSPYAVQEYGFGWRLTKQQGRVVILSHLGSLPPYQAAIGINLRDKSYRLAFWTLAKPSDVSSTVRIRDQIGALIREM